MAGYAKIAELMTRHSELATFQRFDFLNTMNVMFLQAELVHLETELRDSMKEDLESGDVDEAVGITTSARDVNDAISTAVMGNNDEDGDQKPKTRSISDSIETVSIAASKSSQRVKSAKDWYILANMDSSETWDIMLRCRSKLKEYDQAIQQYIAMNKQISPNSSDVKFLRRWFMEETMGDFPLKGLDRNIWETSPPSSLVALQPRNYDDPLNSVFLSKVSTWWHSCVGHRIKKRVNDQEAQYFEYSDKKILRTANILSSVISSVLLVGSIVILAFVKDLYIRLGVVALFTQMFSLALVLVTNARKVEMFAATAAFVAVQVVYVGSSYTPEI